ncbi:MAG TPA: hypothetical protein VJR03_03475 [Nitrospira sp.]|nr:hypothetical protein [Nitrospira sp.]
MVTEPATMLTDYALGVLCTYFSWQLGKSQQARTQMSVRCWAAGMGALAVASFAGGTVHGGALILSGAVLSALWKATAFMIGLASFSFFVGTLAASVRLPLRRLLMGVPILQLVIYTVWLITHTNFRYVIYNYGVTFTVIFLIQMYDLLTRPSRSVGWIIAGVSVSFLAAGVQRSGIAVHPSFNHNDLYHVVQMAGMALLYRGAALLHDRQ